MIDVKITRYINMSQVNKELGTSLRDYEFLQEVANDSYVPLWLDDETVEDLDENIRWEEGKDIRRYKRLQHDLALVNLLRAQGFRDTILVYVSW